MILSIQLLKKLMSSFSSLKSPLQQDSDNNTLADQVECMLADKVRQHPLLYDKNLTLRSGSSHSHPHHQLVWSKISNQLNLDIESCVSLWACIKQRYIKNRKRLSNGDTLTKHWPLYDTLSTWLDQHIKTRR